MERLVVHPAEHQHLAGVVLLDDGGHQPVAGALESCRDGWVKGHAAIVPQPGRGTASGMAGRDPGHVDDHGCRTLGGRHPARSARLIAGAVTDASPPATRDGDIAASLAVKDLAS